MIILSLNPQYVKTNFHPPPQNINEYFPLLPSDFWFLNFQNRVALTEIKFEKSPYLDECGYSFVIMAKGMAAFISELILENRGTFENKRSCDMNAYGVYVKTVQRSLFKGDEKKRYVHIYHSVSKEADERETFENALMERTALLMTAKEALHLYKSRDTSEKLFASD